MKHHPAPLSKQVSPTDTRVSHQELVLPSALWESMLPFMSALCEPVPLQTTLLEQCRINIIPPMPIQFLYSDPHCLGHVDLILYPRPIVQLALQPPM